MKYHPDIDGLRAVAVVAVLAYHLNIWPVSGGFVGVDVFFVISGYLIFQKVLLDVSQDRLNYGDFMLRRIRRLLPASSAVGLLTVILSIAILPPTVISETLRAAVWSFFGLSNVFFWSQTGYFDAAAISKPLLHTWSLGVEFQFYLVFPLLIIGFLKVVPIPLRRSMAILLLLGFLAISETWLRLEPAGAYLLTPARVFEFGIGAAVSMLPVEAQKPRLKFACLLAGLILISACALFYSEETAFPGFAALVPCLGAALVLYARGTPSSLLLLGNRLIRGIGKISYSIYLVHWPLIVVMTQVTGLLDLTDKFFTAGMTLILALSLHYFVEQPFRRPSSTLRGTSARVATLAAVVGSVIALIPLGGKAWQWRFSDELRIYIDPSIIPAAQEATWALHRKLNTPFSDREIPKVLVIGDSQAGDFVNVINEAYGSSIEIRTIPGRNECQVLFTPSYYSEYLPDDLGCVSDNQNILPDPRIAQADTVIVAFNWTSEAVPFVKSDIGELKKRGAKRIFVIGNKSVGSSPLNKAVRNGSLENLGNIVRRSIKDEVLDTNSRLASGADQYIFVDLLKEICPTETFCNVVSPEKMPLYYDHVHFTRQGVHFAAKLAATRGMDLARSM